MSMHSGGSASGLTQQIDVQQAAFKFSLEDISTA